MHTTWDVGSPRRLRLNNLVPRMGTGALRAWGRREDQCRRFPMIDGKGTYENSSADVDNNHAALRCSANIDDHPAAVSAFDHDKCQHRGPPNPQRNNRMSRKSGTTTRPNLPAARHRNDRQSLGTQTPCDGRPGRMWSLLLQWVQRSNSHADRFWPNADC